MNIQSIQAIQQDLTSQKITSKDLITFYLKRIATYDDSLNSLADLNHEAYALADQLDKERKETGPRSALHGIPLVVKDNILTNDTMRTTANAYALRDFYAPFDATIIKKLRDAGAIILAKANCSEFAYFMSMGKMPSGYGSLHGQVKHPYNIHIDPLGSSTGSAVAVAANLAPISIGTETNGSLMSPAQQNSVVSIKPTLGLVSRHGIIPVSSLQDTAGPMSKNVKDAAILLDIIKGEDPLDSATQSQPELPSYIDACTAPITNLRIGLLRFSNYENGKEDEAILKTAKNQLENNGATVIDIEFTYDLLSNLKTLTPEFKRDINAFFASVKPHCAIHSLKDLIDFNQAHAHRALQYGQTIFLQAETSDGRLKDSEYLNARASLLKSIDTFTSLFKEHNLNAIMTTKITGYPPIGGLPSIIIPAKPLKDQSPKSLLFIGEAYQDHTLFSLAYTYEQATKHRIDPSLKIHKKNSVQRKETQ